MGALLRIAHARAAAERERSGYQQAVRTTLELGAWTSRRGWMRTLLRETERVGLPTAAEAAELPADSTSPYGTSAWLCAGAIAASQKRL